MCRLRNNIIEALLIQGRYTYAYSEFVHGHYSRSNINNVRALLINMTISERLDIYSLDFKRMWYRIWSEIDHQELYMKKFIKFKTSWLGTTDMGRYLRKLLETVTGASNICWQFPKGKRLHNTETDIECASREFMEETGIMRKSFQIIPMFKRKVSYIHMGVCYVTIFYVAIQRRLYIDPVKSISLSRRTQIAEVGDIKWMDINQIKSVSGPGGSNLEIIARPAFNYIKKFINGKKL